MKTIEVRKSELPSNTFVGQTLYWDTRSWTVIGERKMLLFKPRWILRLIGYDDAAVEALSAPVTSTRVEADSDSSFLASAAVGYATDSPLIGELAGGDMLGAIVGAALRSDEPASEPEPYRSEPEPIQTPDPSPMLENPEPPSCDSGISDSGSSDSSSDSSSSDSGSSDSSSCDCGASGSDS